MAGKRTALRRAWVGEGRHQVRIFERMGVRGSTFELRWKPIDAARGARETMGRLRTLEAAVEAANYAWTTFLSQGRDVVRALPAKPAKPSRPLTVREVAEEWLAQHPTSKGDTIDGYRSSLRRNVFAELTCCDHHGTPTGETIDLGSMPIGSVTEATINTWRLALSHRAHAYAGGRTLSSSSVKTALATLSPLFTFAVKQGYCASNPVLAPKRAHKVHGARVPAVFETEETFWDWLRTYLPEPYRAPTIVSAYTGIRAAELCALRVADLDWERHRIRIRQTIDHRGRTGTPKSQASEDWVPMHPIVESALRDYLATYRRTETQTVFAGRGGTRMHYGTWYRKFRQAVAAAGLPTITPHGLRHSHACWLADSGVELAKIRELLRHTDVRTTMRYVKIRDAAKHEAIALLKGPPALTVAP